MKTWDGRIVCAVTNEANAPLCERTRYHAAVAEFDRLWETGASRRQPERMKELLLVIEPFENASREHSSKGTRHAIRNP
jgi:hypothetical protein